MTRVAGAWIAIGCLLALVAAAGILIATGATRPSPRDAGCVVQPQAGSVDLHEAASLSSAVVGQLTASRPGHGCTVREGAPYTVCAGGGTWVLTRVSGVSGYVPEGCVDIQD